MPANGLSTGIDTKIYFSDANGVQQFALLESFEASENSVIVKIQCDGVTKFTKFHKGWKGTFTFQRNSDVLDSYIALQEVGQLPGTITETIIEVDGSVSQYSYSNVVLVLADGGTWSGTDIVTQKFSFNASACCAKYIRSESCNGLCKWKRSTGSITPTSKPIGEITCQPMG